MNPNIEISQINSNEMSLLLNKLLADEYILYTKTLGAHWNVEGEDINSLHLFFKSQYESLRIIVDEVAERIRGLGHFTICSLKDFLHFTNLSEEIVNFPTPRQTIETLKNDHESIIYIIRNNIAPTSNRFKELGTSEFLSALLQQHEKMSWMLRAQLLDD